MLREISIKWFGAFWVVLLVGFMTPWTVQSQMVNGNAFLKTNFVQMAIGPCGTYGSNVIAPSGYVSQGQRLGFIADGAKTGWTTGNPPYSGDYFMPGIPEEGFGIEVNGTNYSNNLVCTLAQIPGSIISYANTGNEVSATWQGQVSGLQVRSRTYVPMDALYIVTEVVIKNVSAAVVPKVLYYRNVDPDQEHTWTGSFFTDNAVDMQNPNVNNTALASATGRTHGMYLGLGSRDCRARVSIGGYTNRSASHIWNGVGSLRSSGVLPWGDNAISIAFNFGDITPQDSVVFSYAYVLGSSDLTQALDLTSIGLMSQDINFIPGDSIPSCLGVAIPIELTNTEGYSQWVWSPNTGLNTHLGTSVLSTLTSPQTYTVTGTGVCGTTTLTIPVSPKVYPPLGAISAITGPSSVCEETTVTYSVDSMEGATHYHWDLPDGWGIVSGQYTRSITVGVSPNPQQGVIRVWATNPCDTSDFSEIPVVKACLKAQSTDSLFCQNNMSEISYELTHTSFQPGNQLTAYLSDALGDFSNPITIGSIPTLVNTGTIPVFIPDSIASGTGYRIRLGATHPLILGGASPVEFEILPAPKIMELASTGGYCPSSQGSIISLSGTEMDFVYYLWKDSTILVDSIIGNGSPMDFATRKDSGSFVVSAHWPASVCDLVYMEGEVNVWPWQPSWQPITPPYICFGDSNETFVLTGQADSILWSTSHTQTGFPASGVDSIPGIINLQTLDRVDSLVFLVQPFLEGCQGDVDTFVIVLGPELRVNPISDQSICASETSTSLYFSGPVSGTQYNWLNDNNLTGIPGTGTDSLMSFMGINETNLSRISTIRVQPEWQGCLGSPDSFAFEVKPIPTVNPLPNRVFCPGESVLPIPLLGSVSGTQFTWTHNNTDIGLPLNTGLDTIPGFTTANSTSSAEVSVFSVRGEANGCQGSARHFEIKVNPSPIPLAVPSQSVCDQGNTVPIGFSSLTPFTQYSWTNDLTDIGLALSGTGSIPPFLAINSGIEIDTAQLIVTAEALGCPGASDSFYIIVFPTPKVDSLPDLVYCHGVMTDPVLFSSLVQGSQFAWTNDLPTMGLAASGQGNLPAFLTQHSGSGPMNAEIQVKAEANGCEGPSRAFQMEIRAIDSPRISLTRSPMGTVCPGTLITYSSSAQDQGSNPVYQWKRNGLPMGTNSPSFSSSILEDGDQITVEMASSLACPSPSVVEAVDTVRTYENLQMVKQPSMFSACYGSDVQFAFEATGTILGYQWERQTGSGWVPMSNGPGIQGTADKELKLQSVTSSMNGDQFRAIVYGQCDTLYTATVTLQTYPSATVSIVAAQDTLCLGGSRLFTGVAQNAGTPGWQWRKNGVLVGTGSTYLGTGLQNGDQITVEVISGIYCPATPRDSSAPETILAIPYSLTSVSIISDHDIHGCIGLPIVFDADPVNGGMNPSYQWRINGQPIAGADQAQYINPGNLNQGDVVDCFMESSLRCPDPSRAYSNKMSMNMYPVRQASLALSVSPDSVGCLGEEREFSAHFTLGGVAPRFQWFVNGLESDGDSLATFRSRDFADQDEISLEMRSSEYCVFPVRSRILKLEVADIVNPTVSIYAEPQAFGQIRFIADPRLEGTNPSFQWLLNGQGIPGAQGSTYLGSALRNSDQISLIMVSSLPCSAPAEVKSNVLTVENVLGVESLMAEDGMSSWELYPNPNNGRFRVVGSLHSLHGFHSEPIVHLRIINAMGQLVHVWEAKSIKGRFQLDMNLSHLAAGPYQLIIESGGVRQVRRFTKED